MSTVRYRRLRADHARLLEYVRLQPRVKLVATDGDPPERYQLDYQIRSLRMVHDDLVEVDNHLVEIILPGHYPRLPPQCRMLTPIFHPNIAPHAICVGDHWSAGEPLWSLVVRIGEMIAYQSYNTKSPLNGEAARWVASNLERLPLDLASLMVDEDRESRSDQVPGESPPIAAPKAPPADVSSPAPKLRVVCPQCQATLKVSERYGRQASPLSEVSNNHYRARPIGLRRSARVTSEKPPTQSGRGANEIVRRNHRHMLLVAATIVVLSFLLEARADQRVTPRGLLDCPFPETCPSRSMFGVKCPGCGLMCSFIHLARGDWCASLAIHRIGWLMALAVLLQFPYRLFSLKGGEAAAVIRFVASLFGYFLLVMLVGNWVLDIVVFGL